MSITALTFPRKILSAPLASDGSRLIIPDIKHWDDDDLTSGEVGSVIYATLINFAKSRMEIIELDPSTLTVATTTGILINKRALGFLGGTTADVETAYAWTPNETYVFLGSNPPQIYENLIDKDEAQTITGKKTFPSSESARPRGAADTDTTVNAAYVTFGQLARQAISGAADATETVAGLTEEGTTAEGDSGEEAGSVARLFLTPKKIAAQVQKNGWLYGTCTDDYVPALLTGGTSAQSTAATWAAISNGSFRITIDGTGYNVDAINFSGDATMADVAATIQAALRTATSALETVTWSTDHFILNSIHADAETSAITVLTTSSGTVGTDISGVGTAWMDAESGRGTVTNAVLTLFTLTLTPTSVPQAGSIVCFLASNSVVGATNVNLDTAGVKNLFKSVTVELAEGDIRTSAFVVLGYDGTQFHLLISQSNMPTSANLALVEAHMATLTDGSDASSLHKHTVAILQSTRDITAASSSVTVAHGLGRTPTYTEVHATFTFLLSTSADAKVSSHSHGYSNGSTHKCTFINTIGVGTNPYPPRHVAGNNASYAIDISSTAQNSNANRLQQKATITFDATNVTIAWTLTDTNSGVATGNIYLTLLVH